MEHTPLPPEVPSGSATAHAAIEALYDCARASVVEPDAAALARALAAALARTFRADDVVVAAVLDSTLASKARLRQGSLVAGPSLTREERRFIDWLLQQRQPFAAGARIEQAANAPASPWPDVIAVPALHHQGHPVALLLVARRRVYGRLGSPDLRVLETIAQQAAVAFDRAQLLAQLDSWARGLEALFKFSAAVSSERDPVSLVRDMAEHAARLLKADGGQGGLVVAGASPDDLLMESSAYWHDG
ncbi:MAG: GAF domain-containing protein, partial [Gemmatimonas sp.]